MQDGSWNPMLSWELDETSPVVIHGKRQLPGANELAMFPGSLVWTFSYKIPYTISLESDHIFLHFALDNIFKPVTTTSTVFQFLSTIYQHVGTECQPVSDSTVFARFCSIPGHTAI